jgi:hypothetical protein
MKNRLSRRHFIKQSALFAGATVSLPLLPAFAADAGAPAAPSATMPGSAPPGSEALFLDASARPPAAQTTDFHMGTATAPRGHTLTLDSRCLLRDGQPTGPARIWALTLSSTRVSRLSMATLRAAMIAAAPIRFRPV